MGDLKRKWQIALRRYIIEGRPAVEYAPYFGITSAGFREWIEVSFKSDMAWSGFGSTWQLDHVVPVSFFDLTNEKDLCLCWNFINIRPSYRDSGESVHFDKVKALHYFESLYSASGYYLAKEMGNRLKKEYPPNKQIEVERQISFLVGKKDLIDQLEGLSAMELELINKGKSIEEAIQEAENIRRLSSF